MQPVKAVQKKGWSQFSVTEWHRLSEIASRHESSMRVAYNQAAQNRIRVDVNAVRTSITLLLAEVCDSTARTYGMVFNPSSPVYAELVDDLTEKYIGNVDSPKARDEVLRIVPRNISLSEFSTRTDTYGLDPRAAVRIEQMRQDGKSEFAIQVERLRSISIRGNMIATTETNRIINRSLIALWSDNVLEPVEKARKRRPKVEYIGTSRRQIMESAHKTWMTRRDDKVCKYCDPLEGITARLDAEFDTRYGIFEAPPIHPNCRCFMVLG